MRVRARCGGPGTRRPPQRTAATGARAAAGPSRAPVVRPPRPTLGQSAIGPLSARPLRDRVAELLPPVVMPPVHLGVPPREQCGQPLRLRRQPTPRRRRQRPERVPLDAVRRGRVLRLERDQPPDGIRDGQRRPGQQQLAGEGSAVRFGRGRCHPGVITPPGGAPPGAVLPAPGGAPRWSGGLGRWCGSAGPTARAVGRARSAEPSARPVARCATPRPWVLSGTAPRNRHVIPETSRG